MNVALKCRALLVAALAIQLLRGLGAWGQSTGFSEYDVKAAFLYNFGKFIQWPADSFASTNAPFVIGVYGESPFGNDLADVVHGRVINGHPVVTRQLSSSELKNCQILFICRSEQKNIAEILGKLAGSDVLTVTDDLDPFQSGVMINFTVDNDRIRFEINNTAAEKAGLKISSKLLILATKTTMLRINKRPTACLCARFP